MAFKFSLAAVLRIRESLERKEQNALEQCYRQLYSIQKCLSDQEERIALIRKQYETHLTSGARAVELHLRIEERVYAEQQREKTLQQLAEAQQHLRQQMQNYRVARQRREIVGQLRNTRFEQYRQRESLLEQKARDDLLLLRRQRQK